METTDTTLPRLLIEKTDRYGDRVAMRRKYKGIWQEISWRTYLERVQALAAGLEKLGMERGDHASILGENCPEWVIADLAIQSLGGVSVGVYPTNSAEQVHYILDHSRSRFVVVKDQEQADKVLLVADRLPRLANIVVIDMKGLRNHPDRRIIPFSQVEEEGREEIRRTPGSFAEAVSRTQPDDVSFIVYTSGTTGAPKGAMITHRNIIHQILYALQPVLHLGEQDSILSYLPLCHIFERNLAMAMPLVLGYTVNFAESIDTVQENLREISPTFFAAVPRILEKIHSTVRIKMEDSTRFKRFHVRLWDPPGKAVAACRMNLRPVPPLLRLAYTLGYLWSYRPLRDRIGLADCRCIMSGGAPIAPEILAFFRSLGIRTVEMYGLTETAGGATGPHGRIKHGSVGEPCRALECSLAPDGEILLRGDSIFAGYYRDETATGEVIRDGWLHTGDIGQFDEDGHLFIVDRKKDIIVTSGGKNISPSEIENRLKCSSYIKEAVIVGEGRKYLTALIQIDYDNVGNWAQRKRIPYTTYRSLAENPDIYRLIQDEVEAVNEHLAQVERVKKFHILVKELDQDDEEVTATQKVKRKIIDERFCREIERMYGEGGKSGPGA